MCKFCKFRDFYEYSGEKDTLKSILRINDGAQAIDVLLSRYATPEGKRNAYLALELNIKMNGGEYTVKEKDIAIKYCPFCGEEL